MSWAFARVNLRNLTLKRKPVLVGGEAMEAINIENK